MVICANPAATTHGRPYVRRRPDAPDLIPSPPRHGDLVYCDGVAVAEVYGNLDGAGTPDDPRGCLCTFATEGLPARWVEYVRSLPRGR